MKKQYKFKFESITTETRVRGDGYVFAESAEQAASIATAGVQQDIGPAAVVTSVQEVKTKRKAV